MTAPTAEREKTSPAGRLTLLPGTDAPDTDALPSVSLVIPAYNKAAHLAEAVESVLAQDYPRLDLLVVDDGSSDATPDVLAGFGSRVRWLRQPNAGQSAALNRGWALTSGELVGYLSADDVLAPRAVSALVRALSAAPGAVCAYGDYQLIDAAGRVVRDVSAPEFDFRAMVLRFACQPGPGVLFDRDAATRAGWWNPALRLVPDQDFWLRLALHGPFLHVADMLAQFRVHESGLSFAAPSLALAAEYVRVVEDWYDGPGVPDDLRGRRAQALSAAYLMEARAHLRGERYGHAAARLAQAALLHPANVNLQAARLLAHGVVHHRRAEFRARPGRDDVPGPRPPAPTALPRARAARDVPAGRPVVLTGGGGFVGGHVREALAGRDVLLLARRAPVDLGEKERWAWADLAGGAAALSGRRLADLDVPPGAALCHLAFRPDEPRAGVAMSLGLLAAVNACENITRVVLVSTVSVYGTAHRGLVDETADCAPRSAYGRAKLDAEQPWLAALRPDCELVVLRLGSVLAAGRASSYSLVADALRRPVRAMALGSLRQGTGVHYVTVGDAAGAIRFAVDAPLPASRAVFNVVADPSAAPRAPRAAAMTDWVAEANGDYARMQDVVRVLAGRQPLRRLPMPAFAVDAAARLAGRPRPGQRFSGAALRAAGFVGPVPLADELGRVVGELTGGAR